MTEKDIPFTPSLYFAQQNTREVCEMSAMLQGTIRRSGLGSTFHFKIRLPLTCQQWAVEVLPDLWEKEREKEILSLIHI